MKNIQVIDGARNSTFDIFQASDDEFATIFPPGEDVAFIEEVYARGDRGRLDPVFGRIWTCRIPKEKAVGIHGTLFVGMEDRKVYYPTRRDEEAVNPDGSRLRA
jgi:hypothetical protein